MVKLGSMVKDSITGFKGIAVARTEYVLVNPQKLQKNGKSVKSLWFDEGRLDNASKVKTGGPQETPPAMANR